MVLSTLSYPGSEAFLDFSPHERAAREPGSQAPVVQRLDNAIHRINHYPLDRVVCFVNIYPLDSDLSGG